MLNEKQSKVVEHKGGPLLVLAGAGSGKTRCIVSKIQDLIGNGVDISNILAITFTKKAANEMIDRVSQFKKIDRKKNWISTFHSFCYRILIEQINVLGYKGINVCTDKQSADIMKAVISDSHSDVNPGQALYHIERAKNRVLFPADFRNGHKPNYKLDPNIIPLYEKYQDFLEKCMLVDFGDMIAKVVKLLREKDVVREYYQNKFKYIFVDEYQDVNSAQFELVKCLYNPNKNYLMVVGDDSQAIYGFRDSDPGFIIDFENNFLNTEKIILDRNYRSTRKILDVANYIIDNNQHKLEKDLWTYNEDGDDISLVTNDSDRSEAAFVAKAISKLVMDEGYRYRDFGVLFRINAQALIIDRELTKARIPSKIVKGVSFFDRREIRDILSYLRFINNPYDAMSFQRAIQVPRRGVGIKTIQPIIEDSIKSGKSILEIAQKSGKNGVKKFCGVIEDMGDYIDNAPLLIRNLMRSIKYEDYLKSVAKDSKTSIEVRLENITYLDKMMDDDKSVKALVNECALSTELADDEDDNKVQLVSIHGAKGAEYSVVFLVGVNDKMFPHEMLDSGNEEEARRLFYVAITRAKKKLFISHYTYDQRENFRGGHEDTKFYNPSPFLSELPSEGVDKRAFRGGSNGNFDQRESPEW